jgi:hypothetical protein
VPVVGGVTVQRDDPGRVHNPLDHSALAETARWPHIPNHRRSALDQQLPVKTSVKTVVAPAAKGVALNDRQRVYRDGEV